MKMILLKAFSAVLLACLNFTQPCVAADAPKDGGWVSLFNGKDLSGWAPVYDVTFAVTNGNLRLVDGTGWLRTEKQYANCVLEAEWRALVPAYDSGFFIRAALEGKPWPKDGWQVNLNRSALGSLVNGHTDSMRAFGRGDYAFGAREHDGRVEDLQLVHGLLLQEFVRRDRLVDAVKVT